MWEYANLANSWSNVPGFIELNCIMVVWMILKTASLFYYCKYEEFFIHNYLSFLLFPFYRFKIDKWKVLSQKTCLKQTQLGYKARWNNISYWKSLSAYNNMIHTHAGAQGGKGWTWRLSNNWQTAVLLDIWKFGSDIFTYTRVIYVHITCIHMYIYLDCFKG